MNTCSDDRIKKTAKKIKGFFRLEFFISNEEKAMSQGINNWNDFLNTANKKTELIKL